jgi:hypothetical protein
VLLGGIPGLALAWLIARQATRPAASAVFVRPDATCGWVAVMLAMESSPV